MRAAWLQQLQIGDGKSDAFDCLRYRPLSRDQLRTVYETNRTPAVKRLLWEVHRLRAVVLRANDLVRSIDYNGTKLDPASLLALQGLREALEGEPVVREDAERRMDG